MQVTFGSRQLELGGKYLGTNLRDSSGLLDDIPALRQRIEEDGYLLFRGFHERQTVLDARMAILESSKASDMFDPAAPLNDAVVNPNKGGSAMPVQLRTLPQFKAVVESPKLMGFFDRFLGGPSMTYDYKWLRFTAPSGWTGAHYDIVYMGRGTDRLYTCWTPIGDVTLDMGSLAILTGSHKFDRVKQTYGKMDVDRDRVGGWFTSDPVEVVDRHGGRWETTEYSAGDVIIFGMYTMHASLKNVTNRYRLTCDTRYQLASEPVDTRWIGDQPAAHSVHNSDVKPKSIEQARAEWNV
ncbi:MAG: phytanoyl-CoA dioxygenase family protein [Planctomycetes bacterium]|nr:phytanoyl-CoA dioxygenase family protein [Planctomycetota bacterium]